MSRENNKLPRLRFPEFRGVGEWDKKRLGEVCDVLNNRRQPITGSDRVKGSYPYYGASGIVDYVNEYIFDERLLLVGEDGAKWGAFENTAFVVEGKYWVNNHAHVLRSKEVIDTLLENYLSMIDIGPFITGAAPPKLTLGMLKIIPVPVSPDEKEQQKIAACLSSLDDLITAQTQKLAHLKTHKKGLMQQLFPAEGETQPKLRFPEFQDAGDWEEKTLKDIASIKRGAASQHLNYVEGSNTNAVRLLRINDFLNNQAVFVEDTKDMKRFRVVENDILIAGTGATAGITFLVPKKYHNLSFSYNAPRIRVIGANILFIYQYLKSDSTINQQRNMFVGNAQPFLDTKAIGSFILMLPKNPKEQQKIADCLSSLDDLITAQTQKLAKLKTHKKGLMQQLFPAADEVNG